MHPGRCLHGITLVVLLFLASCGDDGQGPSTVPVCHISPDVLEFRSVFVGSFRDLTFRIENAGGGTLSGTVSSPGGEFEVVGEGSYSLGAGETETFTVRFSPASLGSKACSIETESDWCAALQCTGIGMISVDYYVDAQIGNDQYPGTSVQPWRTITHAVDATGTNAAIRVRPGIYDENLGEVFPIILERGQILVGNIETKGEGIIGTTIYGSGGVIPPQGSDQATIQVAEGAVVAGFRIGAPYATQGYGICSYNSSMTILDNTFISETTDLYGGVRLFGIGTVTVGNNVFMTASQGVYAVNWMGVLVLEGNDFRTMSIPVDILSSSPDIVVRGNRFAGTGQVGVQVQAGTPLIENNRFDMPGGCGTYGAIRCAFNESHPKIRGNLFICARGVRIDGDSAPDLGTAGDPGGNDFAGVSGASVYHTGTAALNAFGNAWPHAIPVCGADIVVISGGAVIWGSGAGEQCP